MSFGFSSGDLVERWSLNFSDIAFVNSIPELAQLGFAIQLKFFAAHGFFVQDHAAIPLIAFCIWLSNSASQLKR
ncbi:hypothetical protein [Rhizobium ruizarguesonis]|uniref:hypothetical protein n=1 Tax=Rhizobium ruizarguesonis TaxID=2081791 RepID=UPI0037107D30